MDWVHPEDENRKFIIEYSLADGQVLVQELKIPNSGFIAGRFLKPMLLPKPGSNPDNPDFYTPADFDIGKLMCVSSITLLYCIIICVIISLQQFCLALKEEF